MDVKDALKEVKNRKFRPLYVLYGKDRYRLNAFIDTLTEQLFTEEEKELGVIKFDTAETAVEQIVIEAESPPFFVERKLILVKDAAVMATGGKDNAKLEHRVEKLLAYLEQPLESSVIVFVVGAEKLDERRKIVKAIKERKSVIAFAELSAAELKQWMLQRAARQNRRLSEDGADLLMVRSGTNMGQLSQELDKLCLHAGEGGVIDVEQIDLLTASTVEEDVFAMVEALSELRIDKALKQYQQLLVRREEPIKIVALIARQFRIMLQIKELEQQHYSPQQMAGQLGLHPYAVKLSAEKGRAFEIGTLGRWLSQLAELDFKMKSGLIDKSLGLELFILSLGMKPGVS
ncbi:DNA polymerase III subunit delta [Paenibacillus sp. HB172176]|uniref:DNA polymerase III subunit delta n=1 Tax=Paenibacillus sp. HB172176 TaxID=2493690 RepID=UPI00143B59A9|nr:DNA polymerase III subunit delta [Paenibacillus sp. HB172176]